MKKSIVFTLITLLLISCNDKLDVKQNYDFSISTWQLPREIKRSSRTEIKFYIEREGDFTDAQYYFEFFQSSGTGSLYDTDLGVLSDRTPYPLSEFSAINIADPLRWEFTLDYINSSQDKVEIEVVITDNFKLSRNITLQFDVKN